LPVSDALFSFFLNGNLISFESLYISFEISYCWVDESVDDLTHICKDLRCILGCLNGLVNEAEKVNTHPFWPCKTLSSCRLNLGVSIWVLIWVVGYFVDRTSYPVKWYSCTLFNINCVFPLSIIPIILTIHLVILLTNCLYPCCEHFFFGVSVILLSVILLSVWNHFHSISHSPIRIHFPFLSFITLNFRFPFLLISLLFIL
jgi:hypothetical protein